MRCYKKMELVTASLLVAPLFTSSGIRKLTQTRTCRDAKLMNRAVAMIHGENCELAQKVTTVTAVVELLGVAVCLFAVATARRGLRMAAAFVLLCYTVAATVVFKIMLGFQPNGLVTNMAVIGGLLLLALYPSQDKSANEGEVAG